MEKQRIDHRCDRCGEGTTPIKGERICFACRIRQEQIDKRYTSAKFHDLCVGKGRGGCGFHHWY